MRGKGLAVAEAAFHVGAVKIGIGEQVLRTVRPGLDEILLGGGKLKILSDAPSKNPPGLPPPF
jgi:hypothetical protein